MMAEEPELFKEKVQETLRRHAAAVNKHTAKELISLIMAMLSFWKLLVQVQM